MDKRTLREKFQSVARKTLSFIHTTHLYISEAIAVIKENNAWEDFEDALRSSNIQRLEKALKKYPNFANEKIFFRKEYPIENAAPKESAAIVNTLLKYGAKTNPAPKMIGDSPILAALKNNRLESVFLIARQELRTKEQSGQDFDFAKRLKSKMVFSAALPQKDIQLLADIHAAIQQNIQRLAPRERHYAATPSTFN